MNELTSIGKYHPERYLSDKEINNVLKELTSLKGIKSLNVEPDTVKVEYYQQLLSVDMVKDALVKAGFPFVHSKKHGFLQKFIVQLGKDNNEEFGGKPPKCCSVD
jgi:copper chaperone CopZ